MADSISIAFDFRDVRNEFKRAVKISPFRATDALRSCSEDIIVPAIKQQIIQKDLVATGELLQSIKVIASFSPTNPSVEILVAAPYAANVELGTRRGGEPDTDRLLAWVKKKKRGENLPAEVIAGKIATKIREKGVPKNPFLVPAFDSVRGKLLICFASRMNLE